MIETQYAACACEECRAMCKRPCWPNPEEAGAMIAAGYAERMMLDWWCADPDIFIVCPAEKGSEGQNAPFWPAPYGCTFQGADGLCEIHGSGFKPYEARVAIHDAEQGDLHEEVSEMWNSQEGRRVVELWKRTVWGRVE